MDKRYRAHLTIYLGRYVKEDQAYDHGRERGIARKGIDLHKE